MVKSQEPSFSCVSMRVLPVVLVASAGASGMQSAPEQAVTAEALVLPVKLPLNESVRWLFQVAEGQGPPSRSRTMAPMMKAMQKAATRGTRTSSTRRRVVGTTGMRSCYRRTLTVSRTFHASATIHPDCWWKV